MNDLEKKLKTLQLKQPSRNLRERILALQAPPGCESPPPRHNVPLHWFIAAIILMGCCGFFLGSVIKPHGASAPEIAEQPPASPAVPRLERTVEIKLVERDSALANVFTFAPVRQDFFAGNFAVVAEKNGQGATGHAK